MKVNGSVCKKCEPQRRKEKRYTKCITFPTFFFLVYGGGEVEKRQKGGGTSSSLGGGGWGGCTEGEGGRSKSPEDNFSLEN